VTKAVQQIEKTKSTIRDILMEQDKKIDTILNDKKYQKKDKKKIEEPEKVFFSLKDHFDQNVGEGQEETKVMKAGSDEDEEFQDAQEQFNAGVSHGDVSVKYNPMKEKRTELPVSKPQVKISIWKILKDSVGKDLSKMAVPVYFNEPISMLQKVSEVLEYENLLVSASNE
jgi:oxysterol-binding protein 1